MNSTNKSLLFNEKCPLCEYDKCSLYLRGRHPSRNYHHCQVCDLIFVPTSFHLCSEEEREIYDQHENNPSDPNYRKFLDKLFSPMSSLLAHHCNGLDFGSGPGPTLSHMFSEAGHECRIYDKFYANESSALETDYDFVTSTEVVEHLANPMQVFAMLFELTAKSRGPVGIMTKLHPQDLDSFERWHYKNDPTHISFFSHISMSFLAEKHRRSLEIIGNDVILFT